MEQFESCRPDHHQKPNLKPAKTSGPRGFSRCGWGALRYPRHSMTSATPTP